MLSATLSFRLRHPPPSPPHLPRSTLFELTADTLAHLAQPTSSPHAPRTRWPAKCPAGTREERARRRWWLGLELEPLVPADALGRDEERTQVHEHLQRRLRLGWVSASANQIRSWKELELTSRDGRLGALDDRLGHLGHEEGAPPCARRATSGTWWGRREHPGVSWHVIRHVHPDTFCDALEPAECRAALQRFLVHWAAVDDARARRDRLAERGTLACGGPRLDLDVSCNYESTEADRRTRAKRACLRSSGVPVGVFFSLISKGSERAGFFGEEVSPGSDDTVDSVKRVPEVDATGSLGRGRRGIGGMEERPELRVDGVGRCAYSTCSICCQFCA